MKFLFPGFRPRALTFSYDDGVEQDIRLMDIFTRYHFAATFNLNSGLWASEGTVYPQGQVHRRMTLKQAREVYDASSYEIATHCVTHASLPDLPDSEIIRELFLDRMNLEKQFSRPLITGMAYPYGTCDARTAGLAESCGIRYARTVQSTRRFDIPKNFLLWNPTCHHDDPKALELAEQFLTTQEDQMSLFYIWGHSYEFEKHDNWDQMEILCHRLSAHNDIWYATNGEICEYVQATRQARFSADGSVIFNPTASKLYLLDHDKRHVLAPGQTLRLI